ncbi:MAG: SIS domain-containing protein [Gammaproteobacteria bacterium]|nr:SIS domain-containing protein [Gammaproteobacteria bacterium]MBT8437874.1 SIS domain-containing protein [Gammaproteobacteria bacterium]
MLSEIETAVKSMTRAEKKVARIVLASPYRILRKSIGLLAGEAGVSEPSVIRFCRAMNCEGFQDFKLQLAQDLATGAHFSGTSLSIDETTPDLITKVIDSSISSLIKVRDSLPPDAVQAAVEMLAGADRIEIYGLGGSGIVAQDAQHKFFRLGVPVVAYSDPTVHSVSASLLEPGCVIVAISQSGVTQDVITSVEIGLAAGAKVVAITAADSPLARLASVCLPMNLLEDEDFYAPIKSRMAHLAIVDVLAVGVALSRGPDFQMAIKRANQTRLRSVPV